MKRRSVFVALLLVGLAMMTVGYAMEQYYIANIADKNGDGVKDWKDADINGDGCVDYRDARILGQAFNQPTTEENWRCDLNGDGFIDGADLDLFRQFFGEGLNMLNPYTNQGKVFVSGVIVAVLASLGIVATRKG